MVSNMVLENKFNPITHNMLDIGLLERNKVKVS